MPLWKPFRGLGLVLRQSTNLSLAPAVLCAPARPPSPAPLTWLPLSWPPGPWRRSVLRRAQAQPHRGPGHGLSGEVRPPPAPEARSSPPLLLPLSLYKSLCHYSVRVSPIVRSSKGCDPPPSSQHPALRITPVTVTFCSHLTSSRCDTDDPSHSSRPSLLAFSRIMLS